MTDTQVSILRLIKRSTPIDGWYHVAESIFTTLIEQYLPDELYESKEENGEHFIKLTNEGQTLIKYF